MKFASFLALLLLALLLLAVPVQAQVQAPIIDMHLHAYSLGSLPPEEPLTGLMAPKSNEKLREETLAALERYNVVLAITSGSQVDLYKKAAPDRIIVGCGFMGNEDVVALRKRIVEGDCDVLAESAPQYLGMAPNDSLLEPYFALAEELDIPVGLHMGLGPPGAAYHGLPKYRMKDSDPLALEEVLIRHPNLRLYVSHAAWPMLNRMIGLLHTYPQVYVDISVINWALPRKEFYTYLKRLVEAGFGKRIMFGSDQMIWPQAIGRAIDAIRQAPFLNKEQKRDILYNNAARFLRLSEEDIAQHHGSD